MQTSNLVLILLGSGIVAANLLADRIAFAIAGIFGNWSARHPRRAATETCGNQGHAGAC